MYHDIPIGLYNAKYHVGLASDVSMRLVYFLVIKKDNMKYCTFIIISIIIIMLNLINLSIGLCLVLKYFNKLYAM